MTSVRQSSVSVLPSILKRAAAAGLMFCGSTAESLVTRSSSVFNESFLIHLQFILMSGSVQTKVQTVRL